MDIERSHRFRLQIVGASGPYYIHIWAKNRAQAYRRVWAEDPSIVINSCSFEDDPEVDRER